MYILFLDKEDKLQNDNAQAEKVSGKEVSNNYPIPYKLVDNYSIIFLKCISANDSLMLFQYFQIGRKISDNFSEVTPTVAINSQQKTMR